MRLRPAAIVLGLSVLAPVTGADAASFVARGAGFGHGIGMSQYGAFGYANQGYSHEQILRAYYRDTQLGVVAPRPTVRVLLASGSSTYSVRGAAGAGGVRLDPARTYRVSQRDMRDSGGRVVARAPAGTVMRVDAPAGGSLVAAGKRYRGAFEVRNGLGINVVGLEDYIRGVVALESPASWPAQALQAQAVAARTYAITTSKSASQGFDHYTDTRSQVYGGVSAETRTTDAAIRATDGKIVVRDGKPVVTYFFSTSGGHTEDIENSFIGALAQPWLKGVVDPFDDTSPRHRWRITMSMSSAASKLSGLYRGTFRGVRVTRRGSSPRIVRAQVLGSGGNRVTTGPELRRRLGLFDTWADFTVVRSSRTKEKPAPAARRGEAPAVGAPAGRPVAG